MTVTVPPWAPPSTGTTEYCARATRTGSGWESFGRDTSGRAKESEHSDERAMSGVSSSGDRIVDINMINSVGVLEFFSEAVFNTAMNGFLFVYFLVNENVMSSKVETIQIL